MFGEVGEGEGGGGGEGRVVKRGEERGGEDRGSSIVLV